MNDKPTETQLWRDAYHIAWIGASNASGVRHTLQRYEDDFPNHPALRAIRGHLAYLEGNGLGPELDDLTLVRDTYKATESAS